MKKQLNFNQNILLKEPGHYYHKFCRVKSGTINNDIINIKKHLFMDRYNNLNEEDDNSLKSVFEDYYIYSFFDLIHFLFFLIVYYYLMIP